MKRLIGVLGLVIAASPVYGQTQCVTEADLQSGITVDFADGTSEIYRSTGPGLMSVDGMDGNEAFFRLELAQGTHLLSYVGIFEGRPDEPTRQTYDYDMAATEMPVPQAGGRFAVDVMVTAEDGVRQEDQVQAYVAGEALVVDGCTYEVIDAYIAYDTGDNYMELVKYMPQLGFGYLFWSEADDGRADENIVTRIRAGK